MNSKEYAIDIANRCSNNIRLGVSTLIEELIWLRHNENVYLELRAKAKSRAYNLAINNLLDMYCKSSKEKNEMIKEIERRLKGDYWNER